VENSIEWKDPEYGWRISFFLIVIAMAILLILLHWLFTASDVERAIILAIADLDESFFRV
jgi:hypothetical protein